MWIGSIETVRFSDSSSASVMTVFARLTRVAGDSPSSVARNSMMLRLATFSSTASFAGFAVSSSAQPAADPSKAHTIIATASSLLRMRVFPYARVSEEYVRQRS
ncbi:hypothetical protein EMIT0P260_30227 [Pseudomonas sp. IT-P260]